jgi:hypothetical protein
MVSSIPAAAERPFVRRRELAIVITQRRGAALANLDRLVLVACLAVVSSCASLHAPGPADGRVVGRVYENDYFGFTLPVPEGWYVAGPETVEVLRETGEKEVLEADPALAPNLEASRSRMHHLVTLSEQPIGEAVGPNPIIGALCEYVRDVPGFINGADYLDLISHLRERSSVHSEPRDRDPVELDGRRFLRRDFSLVDDVISSFIVRRHRDYILAFVLTAGNETEVEELLDLLSEIRFTSTR